MPNPPTPEEITQALAVLQRAHAVPKPETAEALLKMTPDQIAASGLTAEEMLRLPTTPEE